MKLEKLSRLITALNSSAQNVQTTNSGSRQAALQNEEAVKLSSQFAQGGSELSPAEREAKVAALKEQVAAGTYKPSSKDVAQALVNDLFA